MRKIISLLLAALWLGLSQASSAAPGNRHPDIVIRLDQALFKSQALVEQEQQKLGDRIKDLDIELKADGLHVAGHYHIPILPDPKFTAVIDFQSTGPDTFDIQVREIKVLFVDVKALTKTILEAAQGRIDQALQGICTFQYVGEEQSVQVVRVKLDMNKLVPAFPGLTLTDIVTKDGELLFKAAKL